MACDHYFGHEWDKYRPFPHQLSRNYWHCDQFARLVWMLMQLRFHSRSHKNVCKIKIVIRNLDWKFSLEFSWCYIPAFAMDVSILFILVFFFDIASSLLYNIAIVIEIVVRNSLWMYKSLILRFKEIIWSISNYRFEVGGSACYACLSLTLCPIVWMFAAVLRPTCFGVFTEKSFLRSHYSLVGWR